MHCRIDSNKVYPDSSVGPEVAFHVANAKNLYSATIPTVRPECHSDVFPASLAPLWKKCGPGKMAMGELIQLAHPVLVLRDMAKKILVVEDNDDCRELLVDSSRVWAMK